MQRISLQPVQTRVNGFLKDKGVVLDGVLRHNGFAIGVVLYLLGTVALVVLVGYGAAYTFYLVPKSLTQIIEQHPL